VNGKPSELDYQLGAVVRYAALTGTHIPVVATLYAALLPQERRHRTDAASITAADSADDSSELSPAREPNDE
jgi:hypothetical protein